MKCKVCEKEILPGAYVIPYRAKRADHIKCYGYTTPEEARKNGWYPGIMGSDGKLRWYPGTNLSKRTDNKEVI